MWTLPPRPPKRGFTARKEEHSPAATFSVQRCMQLMMCGMRCAACGYQQTKGNPPILTPLFGAVHEGGTVRDSANMVAGGQTTGSRPQKPLKTNCAPPNELGGDRPTPNSSPPCTPLAMRAASTQRACKALTGRAGRVKTTRKPCQRSQVAGR